jgi:hypothetical protein
MMIADKGSSCSGFMQRTVWRVMDQFGDKRGGSEWEPIIILLKREHSVYAPNSQPRIPTRA